MNDDPTGSEDIMNKYQGTGKVYTAPPLVQSREKKEYKSFSDSKTRKVNRFKIVDANQDSYGCSYSHLIDWIYSPEHTLTITTSSRIFVLTGAKLGVLEDLLIEEKIKILSVFDPARHYRSNETNCIIEKLEIISPSEIEKES